MNRSAARPIHGRPSQARASRWLTGALAAGLLRWGAAGAPPPPFRIFFPPAPPALDSAVAAPAALASNSLAAPAGLSPFIDEPFYAPLATRMARGEVGDDLAFRLDTYRATREALRAELRAKLDTLKYTDPPARAAALEAFAREQTPRIVELETEAERLRQDLRWHPTSNNEYLRWMVDSSSAETSSVSSRADQARILLGLAFYHNALSPAQRRLLREISMEETQPGSANVLYFSPETSRILLPSSLPPGLSTEIQNYRRNKRLVENELIRALSLSHQATTALIAAKQAPEFAALEDQAESIRRGLATLEDPDVHPPFPPLSPELRARIEAYRKARLDLQGALLAKVEEVKQSAPASDPGLPDRIRTAIQDYTRANAARYADLDRQRDALRTDIAALFRSGSGSAASAPIDLTSSFSAALQKVESFWQYRDYRLAVLQPGLSPPQRRLLFGAAIESLALPLPGGETLPNAP